MTSYQRCNPNLQSRLFNQFDSCALCGESFANNSTGTVSLRAALNGWLASIQGRITLLGLLVTWRKIALA